MSTLPTDLRNKLERTCIVARDLAEKASRAALESLAVQNHEPYGHMTVEQRNLRNKLRARARQLGDAQDVKGQLSIKHLAQECAYEHWHRMLFARFLAENNLLIEPEMRVAVSLDEVKQLAKDAKTNLWTLAGRYAQTMLPEIFRADDPVLQVPMAREDQLKLEEMLNALALPTFTASDSLGWCYQFWQTLKKKEVNDSEVKIGADELPSVTQLFTEDYMVDFLLDNTLGAWHAGKVLAANPTLAENAKSQDELRRAVALPGCAWEYLRFIKGKDGKWTPAAGTYDGWPKMAKELKCLDPCMGSGHFVVAMFERLVALRIVEEKLNEVEVVAAVIQENLFGLEIDPRCTQIGAFNLALAAWRRVGHRPLPAMNLACSGLAPNTREADWLKIAGDDQKLQRGMERLYGLFQKAAVLGSLINPRAGEGDLLVAAFHELQPLLEKALAQETKDDTAHEMAVTARGLAKAAEILTGQFTLVATNVPYLGHTKHDDTLRDFCAANYPSGKWDVYSVFMQRSRYWCGATGSFAVVSPAEWTFLKPFLPFRSDLLQSQTILLGAKLGFGSFVTPIRANPFLCILNFLACQASSTFALIDVSDGKNIEVKRSSLGNCEIQSIHQLSQLRNPDSRILNYDQSETTHLLSEYATALTGLSAGDSAMFDREFWEVSEFGSTWEPTQTSVRTTIDFSGRSGIVRWENEAGLMAQLAESVRHLNHAAQNWRRGKPAWGNEGVAISLMGSLPVTRYGGQKYDINCCAIIPNERSMLPALWAFAQSGELSSAIRNIDQSLKLAPHTLLKVPFDLTHWQKVAAEKYPHGLPKPFSSDPTQWLFNGHPAGADQPLHVAVARLLGYQWPRQTGSSFPDSPALGPDGLENLADDDGIVCLPSVRREAPAAERLRKLLTVAFGKDWKAQTELELIRATGSDAADLEEWLRNDFFEQHCDLFHQRPFVWHIWDGRKRDGFHALVNYHTLADGDKGRRTLESLTHSYLGDWITRQKDSIKREEEGADERLAAALALKEKLEAILAGEPPYDIFVRWKPLAQQAVGWNPDSNDGVRMNIRPFLANDIPGGKKGAGILRAKPNVKWDKDRGKEPHRDKKGFPWFWNGSGFTGDRVNDVHLTKEQKEKARK